MQTRDAMTVASYTERIAFVVELARHLHAYGTTSQRLEAAIELVAHKLGLACEPWSNPTGIILAFSDPSRPAGETDTTRLIRPGLGDTNLYKLCEADRIAEDVICGRMGVVAGHEALRRLDRPTGRRGQVMLVLGFALASAAVAALFRLPNLDIATAGMIGCLIGGLVLAAQRRPRLHEGFEALAGLLAGTVAILVSSLVAPLNLNTVVIASLIVLLPGMTLALATNELTSRHLVSGTARFAGALMTVINLTIGTAIALGGAELLGIAPHIRALRPQPDWVAWVAMVLAAYSFAVLFQAHRRDYPLVMLSAMAGYLISRFGGEWLGAQAGVFLAALATTAAGNAYARWANRPGALIRLPGIIMLVPGSVALRGVISLVQAQSLNAGQDAALAALNTLMALLAGLIFGNLLVSARRNL
ncbi:threonine/serine exporter ThrE family protein [Thermomonas sp.]|uniref:threonine/serine ThrE exporter family protein n=1 Tax=Thermomonas sp. TaxID=1971895 RepID=UPI0035B430CF